MSKIYAIAGGVALIIASGLAPSAVLAQSSEDIIRIGGSSQDWQFYQSYWRNLLEQSAQAAQDRQSQRISRASDPQNELDDIIENLKIQELFLEPIIKLNGSSQVFGVLTNTGDRTVTVSGINFEIVDEDGLLIQTGSAQPEPATVAPGQTVTFTRVLLTIPPDVGYDVQLSEPAFVLAPG